MSWGRTLRNGLLGAVFTLFVFVFLYFLSPEYFWVLSPLLGGLLAGFLEKGGKKDGAKAGMATGLTLVAMWFVVGPGRLIVNALFTAASGHGAVDSGTAGAVGHAAGTTLIIGVSVSALTVLGGVIGGMAANKAGNDG